jgi:cytochrome P450
MFKEKGEELPSFGKYLLERQMELGLSDDETAYLAGSLYGAGSDTTASAVSISILAAACYPQAQAKVQEELENVIGKERGESSLRMLRLSELINHFLGILAPTLADQEMLPQTTAFVLESFRWRPVTAGGTYIQCPRA